jgi:hypothetical protein
VRQGKINGLHGIGFGGPPGGRFLRGAETEHAPPGIKKQIGCGLSEETAAGYDDPWQKASGQIEMKTNFQLGALGVVLGLAAGPLGGRFEGAQSAHFFEDALLVELRFQALERAINGLSFANDDFRHIFTYFLWKFFKGFRV